MSYCHIFGLCYLSTIIIRYFYLTINNNDTFKGVDMWRIPEKKALYAQFGKYSKVAGILFMLLGLAGILFPFAMSLVTTVFVATLLFAGGVIAAYFTYLTDKSDYLGWLKSFLLIAVAFLMIYYPMAGVVTVGLLMAMYFFMDAFTSFSMSMTLYPNKGWGYWLFNAALSLFIAVFLVVNVPHGTMFMVGILVGFSLFFDGFALFMGGRALDKLDI